MRASNHRGGGVSIFIHKSREATPYLDLQENSANIECIFVQLSSGQVNTVVGCIYRPPTTNHSDFLQTLESKLSFTQRLNVDCIFCGDFNYCLYKCSTDFHTADFYNLMNTHSFTPIIHKPTRVTDNSFSIIDNIFVNNFSVAALAYL